MEGKSKKSESKNEDKSFNIKDLGKYFVFNKGEDVDNSDALLSLNLSSAKLKEDKKVKRKSFFFSVGSVHSLKSTKVLEVNLFSKLNIYLSVNKKSLSLSVVC